MRFADWLNEMMKQRNLSQSELARRAGISQSGISLILSGERNPGSDVCRGIADALDLPPKTVFIEAGLFPPEPDFDPDAEEVLRLFRKLPPTEKDIILIQMRALARRERIERDRSRTPEP